MKPKPKENNLPTTSKHLSKIKPERTAVSKKTKLTTLKKQQTVISNSRIKSREFLSTASDSSSESDYNKHKELGDNTLVRKKIYHKKVDDKRPEPKQMDRFSLELFAIDKKQMNRQKIDQKQTKQKQNDQKRMDQNRKDSKKN